MSIRTALVAIAGAAVATAAGAQPNNGNRPPQANSPTAAPRVALASAGNSRPPAAATAGTERPAEPAQRPAPRVTTCRCGDPQPDLDPQEQ